MSDMLGGAEQTMLATHTTHTNRGGLLSCARFAMSSWRPLGQRVWLKPIAEHKLADRTAGGLWLPPQVVDQQQDMAGEIVALGEDCREAFPAGPLLPGLRVFVRQFAPLPIEADIPGLGRVEGLRVCREDDILGYLEETQDDTPSAT